MRRYTLRSVSNAKKMRMKETTNEVREETWSKSRKPPIEKASTIVSKTFLMVVESLRRVKRAVLTGFLWGVLYMRWVANFYAFGKISNLFKGTDIPEWKFFCFVNGTIKFNEGFGIFSQYGRY